MAMVDSLEPGKFDKLRVHGNLGYFEACFLPKNCEWGLTWMETPRDVKLQAGQDPIPLPRDFPQQERRVHDFLHAMRAHNADGSHKLRLFVNYHHHAVDGQGKQVIFLGELMNEINSTILSINVDKGLAALEAIFQFINLG